MKNLNQEQAREREEKKEFLQKLKFLGLKFGFILLICFLFSFGISLAYKNRYDYQNRFEKNEENFQKLQSCLTQAKHQWNSETQTCEPMEEINDCVLLDEFQQVEVSTLPIGYENITDNYEDDKIEIRIFCTGVFMKPNNITGEEYDNPITENSEIHHYRIMGRYAEPVELCWD